MRKNRILTEELRQFLTTDSPNRNYLIEHVRQNIGNGARSVVLCFRGTAATLYYRCHQLLKIRSSRTVLIGEFDFGHARFTHNYKQILAKLHSLRVDASGFSDQDVHSSNRYVRFCLTGEQAVTPHKLKEILQIYKNLIDDFLDPSKVTFAFNPKNRCKKSNNLEKDRQQQLYAAYFLQDDLTYYDLEYAEHYAEKDGVHGRYDLLGLRRNGDCYTLLLTELKSTSSACFGKSGVSDHERDTLQYLNSSLIDARKVEACQTLKLLCEIFGKEYPTNLTPNNITQAKGKFVFSDKSIGAGKRFTPCDDRIEKSYLCPTDGIEKLY